MKSIKLGAAFPGGNLKTLSIKGRRASLEPEMRDSSGAWFYWQFQADFNEPGVYEFVFEGRSYVGSRGPAASFDGGLTWSWLGCDAAFSFNDGEGFKFEAAKAPLSVRFAVAIPYRQSDLERFLATRDSRLFRKSELCASRKGRAVELIRIGSAPKKLLLTCRHHACESMASYVLEGVMRHALRSSGFRSRFELIAVPFADKDGVEDGDQGKNRCPHDHARDYGDAPIYPEVAAIMSLVKAERPALAIDLHCPWLKGGDSNERPYFVGVERPERQASVDALSEILERNAPSSFPFKRVYNIPFGKGWNTPANYSNGKPLFIWGGAVLPPGAVCASMEIPFANVGERTVDAASARGFGEALAASISELLRER